MNFVLIPDNYVVSFIFNLIFFFVFFTVYFPTMFTSSFCYLFTHLCCSFALHQHTCQPHNPLHRQGPASFPWRPDQSGTGSSFHNVSTTQRHHALAALQDLLEEFSISLCMTIAQLSNHILFILHLHAFHTFIEQIPPAIIYPTSWQVFLTMTKKQCDLYLTQSELPPYQSISPIPVPALTSSNSSLLSHLSSPAPLDTSFSLTAVDPEYGLDEDAVTHNQSFVMHMDNNQLVISSSTRLLHVLSLIALLPFSLSAFGVLVEAIIERTAPTTCTSTVIFPCQDILKLLVWLPNAIFAVIGEIANDSVQPGFVTCANKEVTLLTTVQLTFFSWSRLPISLGLPLPLDRDLPSGVLIKPGVWLYEGGNVTICLLASSVFLFSLHCRTHLLFGMFSYDWIHCLLLFDSLNVSFIEL